MENTTQRRLPPRADDTDADADDSFAAEAHVKCSAMMVMLGLSLYIAFVTIFWMDYDASARSCTSRVDALVVEHGAQPESLVPG